MELATFLASWLASNSQELAASNVEFSHDIPTSSWDIMLLCSCGRMPLQQNTFNKNHVIVFCSKKISNSIYGRMCVSNCFFFFWLFPPCTQAKRRSFEFAIVAKFFQDETWISMSFIT